MFPAILDGESREVLMLSVYTRHAADCVKDKDWRRLPVSQMGLRYT
jgi:hypothetical protein